MIMTDIGQVWYYKSSLTTMTVLILKIDNVGSGKLFHTLVLDSCNCSQHIGTVYKCSWKFELSSIWTRIV